MTEPGDWRNGLQPRVADEAEFIISAFRDPPRHEHAEPPRGKEVKVVPTHDGGIAYMYIEGEILVRDEYLERVLEILGHPPRSELERAETSPLQPVIAGVTRLTALGDRHALSLSALDAIDERLGRGIATPDHVLTAAGGTASNCPATEPEEVYNDIEPYPSVCDDNGGAGVLVYLADTGLLADAATSHSWLAGVTGDPDPGQPQLVNGTLTIPSSAGPYAGHGTFTAGVARCMAPAAEIFVADVAFAAGSITESELIPGLQAGLGLGVDIYHLNLACLSRHDFPLIAFGQWLRRLREYGGAVCVAPAGNSGVRRPAWPSAFAEVISVGALGADWRGRASFSNFGPQVNVYAPGRDLVNAYATGTYTCSVAPYTNDIRDFYGMAKWSGTSFSSPIVTGLIASRMSRVGENAQQAAAALLAEARCHSIPGVGPVLLPGCRGERPACPAGPHHEGGRCRHHGGCPQCGER